MDFKSDINNFKYSFEKMTKIYGRQFIEHCRASWITCKDIMSVEEFCKMNAKLHEKSHRRFESYHQLGDIYINE